MVAVDDGMDNTLDASIVYSLFRVLQAVKDQAGALVVTGRPGYYSTGLDMRAEGDLYRAKLAARNPGG